MKVKCPCGSELFHIHAPPEYTSPSEKIVYLACSSCQKTWPIKVGTLPEIDSLGVLKHH